MGKEMMRAAGKSPRHRRRRGDDGGNEALPQTSNVESDKRRDNGGREVVREYAAEKKQCCWSTIADWSFQGWLM